MDEPCFQRQRVSIKHAAPSAARVCRSAGRAGQLPPARKLLDKGDADAEWTSLTNVESSVVEASIEELGTEDGTFLLSPGMSVNMSKQVNREGV